MLTTVFRNRAAALLTGTLLLAGLAGTAVWLWPANGYSQEQSRHGVMEVYKSPQCGCCTDWVDYLRDEGFEVTTHEVGPDRMNTVKAEAGLRRELTSCHTGFVDGYVIEGHVPAAEIRRLLDEQPDVTGLAVPGMPVGSPGMEMGDRRDPFNVLIFDENDSSIYARYHQ